MNLEEDFVLAFAASHFLCYGKADVLYYQLIIFQERFT